MAAVSGPHYAGPLTTSHLAETAWGQHVTRQEPQTVGALLFLLDVDVALSFCGQCGTASNCLLEPTHTHMTTSSFDLY